jgi:hypothetical protein
MAYLDYPAIFSFGLFSPKDFQIIWLSDLLTISTVDKRLFQICVMHTKLDFK